MENRGLVLTYAGMDSWDRPVYREPDGRLWKDVSPVRYSKPRLCTSVNNEFDGEPYDDMYEMGSIMGLRSFSFQDVSHGERDYSSIFCS